MPIIDPITRDYDEMARKVAACCRDRLKTDKFCAEVDRMMKLRAQRRPKEMAQACIDERAKKLLMQNRAGWARDPSQPQQAVLVDKQGCVLTNLDNKPIKPWTGAGVHPGAQLPGFRSRPTYPAPPPFRKRGVIHLSRQRQRGYGWRRSLDQERELSLGGPQPPRLL